MTEGKKRVWIVIANGSRARLMEVGRTGKVTTIELLESATCRIPSRDLVSDRPGRTLDRVGAGRHGLESPNDPHRIEREKFAREVADHVDGAHGQKQFSHLILIAPPQMLGALRGCLQDTTREAVVLERPKDVTSLPIAVLNAYLSDLLTTLEQHRRGAMPRAG